VSGGLARALASAIAAGVAMLSLPVRLEILRLPERTTR